MEFLGAVLPTLPDGHQRPYLCDSYDGSVDIVWHDRKRAIIVCVPSSGDIEGAVRGEGDQAERKVFADGGADSDLLRWIAGDIRD